MGAMPTALGAALCLLRGRGRNSYAPLLVAVADIVDAAKITAGEIVAAASDAAVPSRELPCQLCAPNIRPIATLLLHNVSNAHRAVRIHTLRILAGFSSFYLGKFTGSPLGNAGRDMSPALDICLVAERMPITMASERSRNVLLRRLESLAASERLPWAHTYAVAQYAASLFYVRYSRMWPGALRILTSLSKSRGPGGGKLFRAALPYILKQRMCLVAAIETTTRHPPIPAASSTRRPCSRVKGRGTSGGFKHGYGSLDGPNDDLPCI